MMATNNNNNNDVDNNNNNVDVDVDVVRGCEIKTKTRIKNGGGSDEETSKAEEEQGAEEQGAEEQEQEDSSRSCNVNNNIEIGITGTRGTGTPPPPPPPPPTTIHENENDNENDNGPFDEQKDHHLSFQIEDDNEDDNNDDDDNWNIDILPPPPPSPPLPLMVPDDDDEEESAVAIAIASSASAAVVEYEVVDVDVDVDLEDSRYDILIKMMGLTSCEELLPLTIYCISSFVFILSCISKRNHFDDDRLKKNQGYYKYSLSVGIIGFLFSLFLIIWIRINIYIKGSNKEGNKRDIRSGDDDDENNDVQDQDQQEQQEQQQEQQEQEQQGGQQDLLSSSSSQQISIVDKYRWLINGILFIWSLFGVLISTFKFYLNAFNTTGNGYFSIWAMFLVSIWNYGVTIDMIEKQLLSSADACVYGLGIASIILVIELSTELALYDIREDNRTTEEEDPTIQIVGETTDPKISIYTLILSIISILYGLFTAGRAKLTSNNFRIDPKLQLIFLGIFVILWLIAAFLCTLIGPFTHTGNGYFAIWGCVLCTVLAIFDTRKEIERLYI